jgi:hypothetical protein
LEAAVSGQKLHRGVGGGTNRIPRPKAHPSRRDDRLQPERDDLLGAAFGTAAVAIRSWSGQLRTPGPSLMWLADAIRRDMAFRCTESPQRDFAKQSRRYSYAIRIS